MGKPINISDSEWEVMNVVWSRAPVAASEIVAVLSAKNGWHSRTIRTLLDRLVKKKALVYEVDGKRYLYRAKVLMDVCVRQASQGFLQRVFGGEPGSMLIHLVQHAELSDQEIAQLKRILSEKEK
jgi:BlaI family transcriptional regulator, penicillinase repressor